MIESTWSASRFVAMMLRACTAVSLSCVLTAAALGTVKGPASAQPSITKSTKTSMSTVSLDKEMLVGPKAAKQQGKRLTPPVGLTPESLAATLGAKNLATFDLEHDVAVVSS